MIAWKQNKKQTKHHEEKNNRINLVMAIVFLLGVVTIYKLYVLQILKGDFYKDMALGQHQIVNQLEADRGDIFMYEYKNNEAVLFPCATEKDFALVFAIPKEVTQADKVGEVLYEVFKKEGVEEEVDELLEQEKEVKQIEELNYIKSLEITDEEKIKMENETLAKYEAFKYDSGYLDYMNIKREAEINLRKDAILEEYHKILSKENDPYEPIEKKVDDETLKDLYAKLLSINGESVAKDDLDIKEGNVVYKDSGEKVEVVGISHNMISHRYYPEGEIGSHVLGFVSDNGEEKKGIYGIEGYFNQALKGVDGSIVSETGAGRSVIILNDREYNEPIPGDDIVLTIDRSVQYKVCSLLNEAAKIYDIEGGSIIVMNPFTGEIVAMCSWPNFDPNNYKDTEDINNFNNPVVFSQYEPGSVMKPITMAASLDQERITPETTYNDEGQIMIQGWDKPIRNSDYETHGGHGIVNMNYVLENSLNTGAIFAMRQIGSKVFAEYLRKFGFGEPTGIELSSEGGGNISNLDGDEIHEIYSATASFGQGITVTPLQLINAYAAIANGGILMQPHIVKEIIKPDGTKEIVKPQQIRRVVSNRAATLLGGMLVNVVEGGHAALAKVDGYYVGGKTGTAQVASSVARGYSGKTIQTFVGYAPIDEPAFVMLVKLDNPKKANFAANSSAPLFGQIAEFLLNYYQVPKER